MWEKAVLKAPFCFVRKDTQNAVNPPTQLARGLHYHKGVFLGDCSVWWKNLALVPTLLKESSWEKLISGALERERQVKWRLKKKRKKKKGKVDRKDEALALHQSAMLGIVSRALALMHPHNDFPTHTAPELTISFIHSSHPGSHCVFAWSVKRRKEIWVLRHFPDFTLALCFLVHPSSFTQCIRGLYRRLPLCHSQSHVMAIQAINLGSIPVYVNMAKACCKHTIQLQNNVI